MSQNIQEKEEPQQEDANLLQSIAKNALGLALFAFITVGIIGLVQVTTKEKITFNIEQAQARALYEIVPKNQTDNDLLTDTIKIFTAHTTDNKNEKFNNLKLLGPFKDGKAIHLARKNGQLHSLIFPVVAPDGYTTGISLLIGIAIDDSIRGVRIIDHKETPGLGDKIDLKKSDWVLSFNDASLNSPSLDKWKVKKDGGDFDQFTGATITPRAVVSAVKNTLLFFQENKVLILELAQLPHKPNKIKGDSHE